jgi:LacI family transcriptional regulator
VKVTIADVAREAGVSSQTVSRVINNKGELKPETRRSVIEVIERLGYRPSSIARSLATKRTHTLGLSVPDIDNPFWPGIARGIEDVAWQHGYHVFLCNTTEDPKREEAVLQLLEGKRVDGVIVAGSRLPDERLLPLIEKHSAVVLVNRVIAGGAAGSVRVDAAYGATLAINHLLARQRRCIAHLAGPPASQNSQGHINGYTCALQAAGYPVDQELIRPGPPYREDGLQAAKALLAARPDVDALYCYNDLVAIGAMQACAELGLRVPEDIAVVGYDDILLAGLVTPALTTLRISKYNVGAAAARMLFERISGQVHESEVVMRPELVIRASAP